MRCMGLLSQMFSTSLDSKETKGKEGFVGHRCCRKLNCGKHIAFFNPIGQRVGSSVGAVISFSSFFSSSIW